MAVRLYGLTWLARQAVRMRRSDWRFKTPQLLAEEIYTVLVRLRDAEQPSITFPGTDGPKTVNDTQLPNLDFTFPEGTTLPVKLPTNTNNPSSSATVRTIWQRDALPCKIGTQENQELGNVGKLVYNCTLYPYADMTPIKAGNKAKETATGDIEGSKFTIEAKYLQMQLDEDEIIPEGTWTVATYIQQFQLTETFQDGSPVGQSIKLLQAHAYGQVPIWL